VMGRVALQERGTVMEWNPSGMKHSSLVELRHWIKMVWAAGIKTK
jgi:hypothetical protein